MNSALDVENRVSVSAAVCPVDAFEVSASQTGSGRLRGARRDAEGWDSAEGFSCSAPRRLMERIRKSRVLRSCRSESFMEHHESQKMRLPTNRLSFSNSDTCKILGWRCHNFVVVENQKSICIVSQFKIRRLEKIEQCYCRF